MYKLYDILFKCISLTNSLFVSNSISVNKDLQTISVRHSTVSEVDPITQPVSKLIV